MIVRKKKQAVDEFGGIDVCAPRVCSTYAPYQTAQMSHKGGEEGGGEMEEKAECSMVRSVEIRRKWCALRWQFCVWRFTTAWHVDVEGSVGGILDK